MSYGKITARFWMGRTGRLMRAESPWVRLLAVYLMTCPSKTMTGLYYLPLPTLVHELGCTRAEAVHALRRLRALGFAFYDPEHELVWVVNMAREQVAAALHAQDKRVPYVQRLVRPYLRTPLGRAWLARYGRAFRCDALMCTVPHTAGAAAPSADAGAGAGLDELEQLALEGDEPPGLEELALEGDEPPGLEELAQDLAGAAAPSADAGAGAGLDELEQLALEGDEPPGLEELAQDLARADEAAAGAGVDEQLALEGDEPPGLEELAQDLARADEAAADAGVDEQLALEGDEPGPASRSGGAQVAQIAAEAVRYLSAATGRSFRVTLPVRRDIARLLERWTHEDIEAVIRVKAQQWRGDARMAQHLTPRVLFRPENFERYLEEDVRAGPVLTPEEAWAIVNKEMSRVGGKWGKPVLDPLIMAAVNRVGWGNLCQANAREAPRMFLAAFTAATIERTPVS